MVTLQVEPATRSPTPKQGFLVNGKEGEARAASAMSWTKVNWSFGIWWCLFGSWDVECVEYIMLDTSNVLDTGASPGRPEGARDATDEQGQVHR